MEFVHAPLLLTSSCFVGIFMAAEKNWLAPAYPAKIKIWPVKMVDMYRYDVGLVRREVKNRFKRVQHFLCTSCC